MAKEYAYYIEGNKVAIVERDTAFDNNVNSKEYGPGVSRAMWKSPKTSVTDGLEIKYAYNPKYFIKEDEDYDTTITKYKSNDGYLQIDGTTNFSGGIPDLSADTSYIVLKNAGKFNGLHRVKSFATVNTTNDSIVLYTKYSGHGSAWVDFEETVYLYYNVDALNDEADTIDIPSYLSKALVYYVKARLAEDSGQIELKEYNMREYKKHIEQYESSLMKGPRIMSSGPYAIR
tara:strand:+ start:1580 stop:2272 length:693 start_codon:yes stop_codon:yes gene_type:complete